MNFRIMRMDNEWATELAESNIKFKEEIDRILFYDPEEKSGTVIIREHRDSDMDLAGYKSRRIGEMSYAEFDKLPKAIRLE